MQSTPPLTLEDALVIIDKQAQIIAEQNRIIQRLEARIKELEAQLNKNSKNSSKPPSTDQKGNPPVGQNRGGAKLGHKGYFREAFPKEKVTQFIQVFPPRCDRCGSDHLVSERKPLFHQVLDLLKIQTEVTEYRLEQCRCQNCGRHVKADLPPGVSRSVIGPRLAAWIATSSCELNLSTRKIRFLVEALSGEAFSHATIWNRQQEMSASLSETYQAIQGAFEQEKWVGADETPWRTCGRRRYVWLGSGIDTTVVKILPGRSMVCAQELLKKGSRQPVVTDRYGAYNYLKGPHQYCLAHWIRDVAGLKEETEASQIMCEDIEYDLKEVFSIWHRYRLGQLARDQFLRRTGYHRRQISHSLEWGYDTGENAKIWNFCERSLSDYPKFWTYLRVKGMEPTNNATERDLRPLVIRRKICYGTGSDGGERYLERIYSLAQTLKKRGRNLLEYLEEAIYRYRAGCPSPPLPAPAASI